MRSNPNTFYKHVGLGDYNLKRLGEKMEKINMTDMTMWMTDMMISYGGREDDRR